MIDWPPLNIGGLEIEDPIIQGGMGVKVSLSGLAGSVANEGGVGMLASVGLGDHENSELGYAEANAAGLRNEIRKTREMTDGKFGVNVMKALTDYESLVQATVDAKVPLLFTGAGFDPNLPEKIKGSNTMAVPIISYAKFIPHVLDAWGKHNYLPAAIVIEGPKAGGHLGYGRKRLDNPRFVENSLEKEVRKAVEMADGRFPVIAAGGIWGGEDIYAAIHKWGASGVQMGTRFVVTDECDVAPEFKEEYLRAEKEDIVLIKSPAGFPGRVVENDFVRRMTEGIDFKCEYHCLETCNPKETRYCIASALKEAGEGNLDHGFAFAGSNAWRCDKIIPVKELMGILKSEYLKAARK